MGRYEICKPFYNRTTKQHSICVVDRSLKSICKNHHMNIKKKIYIYPQYEIFTYFCCARTTSSLVEALKMRIGIQEISTELQRGNKKIRPKMTCH